MKKLISLTDLEAGEIYTILDRADFLKDAWTRGNLPRSLAGKRIALWFYGNGFRNRLAFELGLRSLGAEVHLVPGQPGEGEVASDAARYLAGWFDMLIVRSRLHSDLVSIADSVTIPVINARTDYNHPCEILGDLQYIRRERGSLDGLQVVFAGECTNLCMSWFEAAVRLPVSVIQAAPPGYEIPERLLTEMRKHAVGHLGFTHDIDAVLNEGVDVLYTDCWPKNGDPETIRELFTPFRIDGARASRLRESSFYLPCPPVTRGQEVSDDSLSAPSFRNFPAKECLLHAQSALVEYLLIGF